MTQDWTARFLFPSGEISILSPEAVLSVPRALGFARRQDELAVFGMSEDGTGGLHFGSYETAWRHIREHGGLVSLTGEGGEVQLSASRITGLLAGELEVVGDVALFDEIRVSASAQALTHVESVQRLITDGLCEMGTLMRARFAWGTSDQFVEHNIPLPIHLRVKAGEPLPVRLPWCLADVRLAIGRQLTDLCRARSGSCRRIGTMVEYREIDPFGLAAP